MRVAYATAPGTPGRRNEDFVIAGPDWVVVLDGATAPAGVESGCVHDVPWLVARLAAALARGLVLDRGASLQDILGGAIGATMKAHVDTCDLANPDSPSSTVAMLRRRGESVDYLVLCDSPVVLATGDGGVEVVHDDRTEHLPGGRPYSFELVRSTRNRPGGFWVASTDPGAAHEALTGSVAASDLDGALVLTDGVTRLVEWFGYSWETLRRVAEEQGPARLISLVREEEGKTVVPRPGKPHDDATAAWVSFAE
ncbi:hypothetical protein Ssi03_69870 [Sphaerisporangium siamense]|nr:hypothetical protein Ssi03_69870 [Sphaerisporangium siamense]